MRVAISHHGFPFLVFSFLLVLSSLFLTRDWAGWARYSSLLFSFSFLAILLIFFRDPGRRLDTTGNQIISPADGKVIKVSEGTNEFFPGERGTLVSIFMSIWNVHVNRVPMSGTVIRKVYRRGKYLPAFRDRATDENEQCTLIIEGEEAKILVKQVSGILARRIITYPEEGEIVKKGDRFGMILFGSRLDIFLPPKCNVLVSCGEKTVAGRTVLGVL